MCLCVVVRRVYFFHYVLLAYEVVFSMLLLNLQVVNIYRFSMSFPSSKRACIVARNVYLFRKELECRVCRNVPTEPTRVLICLIFSFARWCFLFLTFF